MRDMRYKMLFVLVASALAILPGKAQAQDKKAHFTLGGGFTVPNSSVKDHFGNGYNFNIGFDVDATPAIGIEGLYSFNGLGQKQISLPVSPTPSGGGVPTDFFADMNMQYGTVNVIFQKPEGSTRPYGLVGMGVYLPAGQSHHAWRRLCPWLLRPLVLRLLSGRMG